jgi:hypothetical protein
MQVRRKSKLLSTFRRIAARPRTKSTGFVVVTAAKNAYCGLLGYDTA